MGGATLTLEGVENGEGKMGKENPAIRREILVSEGPSLPRD